jgi:hypothetical protein
MDARRLTINRAPVLTLWAAVVAERLGFDHAEALTLGKAVAGLNAYAKGVRLGIYQPTPASVKEERKRLAEGAQLQAAILQRAVPVARTPEGLRALAKDKPINPATVERYLASKFGASLAAVSDAMKHLAASLPPDKLATHAYALYEEFRPAIPAGEKGWGAAGILDLDVIERLAKKQT